MKRNTLATATLLFAAMFSVGQASAQTSMGSLDIFGSLGSSIPGSSAPNENAVDYVALGDSYAAYGSVTAPTTGPEPCRRANDNYPSGVLSQPNIQGTDASCGGAVTDNVLRPWDRGGGVVIPAQADSLNAGTDLVTLSIGGNDINFGAIASCFFEVAQDPNATPCKGRLEDDINQRYAALPAKLDAVHSEIDRRSPNAQVIVTGYYILVTDSGACSEAGAMSLTDRAWMVDLTDRLNVLMSDAASRHGAKFVLPANADQHTACADSAQRWVDGSGRLTNSHSMHPTALGQKVMADAVVGAI